MTLRRVVITGLSAITPLGNDLATSWSNLLNGESGVSLITTFDTSEHQTKFAGLVQGFDPTAYISPKQARRLERFCTFSIACSKMLLEHAGLDAIPPEDQ
ncbi:MAG: beta-ketoacyl synthase N-terminal-like domain-containing protein, partial [Oceanidesulfovibrio sp.]